MNSEWATAFSDFVLAGLAVGLAGLLRRPARRKFHPVRLLSGFLACTALAAGLGGLWHGYHEVISRAGEFWLWKFTMFSVGVGNFLVLTALARAIHGNPRGSGSKILDRFILLKLAVFVVAVLLSESFLPAVGDQVFTEFIGLSLVVRDRSRERRLPAGWLVAGFLLSLAAGLGQMLKLGLGDLLNHNVIYHLLGMLSLGAFYRAAVALGPVNTIAKAGLKCRLERWN